MAVKTYSLKADGEKQLSKNFKVKEFRCKDGSDKILISDETVIKLQNVRDYFGKSVKINSAYRTPSYNKKVGGATLSQHVKGTACDIAISDVPPKAIAAYLEKFYPNSGIGLYSTFVHIDSRGYKSRWKNTGSNVVSKFNLGNIYEQYKAKPESIERDDEMVTDRPIVIFGKHYDTKGILKDGSNYLTPKVLADAGFIVSSNGSEPVVSMPTLKLKVAGKNRDITGFSSNGTTYAGIRQLAEALGHKVDWDNESKTIIID